MSTPDLNWDAMLKTTKTKLELMIDLDMYIFFGKGTSEWDSCISNRYSEANNKYFKSYDTKQKSKHYIYLDAKKIYGNV